MRVIIAGTRTIDRLAILEDAIKRSAFDITEVVSGGARGVDKLGELWARQHGIKCTVKAANWERDGKRAGYLRNVEMAKYADALLAIWDGTSPGTGMMIRIAKERGLRVFVFQPSLRATFFRS